MSASSYVMGVHKELNLRTLIFLSSFSVLHLHRLFLRSLGEQARVGVLMLALLFFNNVFFGLQIFSPFPRFFFRYGWSVILSLCMSHSWIDLEAHFATAGLT